MSMELSSHTKGQLTRWNYKRRATYPEEGEPETLALAETYRVTYRRARMLKALSFGTMVSVEEMAEASGVPETMIALEIKRLCEHQGMSLRTGLTRDRRLLWYLLEDRKLLEALRATIRKSWVFPH